jgi:hypothetical protein
LRKVFRPGAKNWEFFYYFHGRQRSAGLGSAARVAVKYTSLEQAREKAARFRSMLARDIDPLEAKKSTKFVRQGK